MWYFIIAGFLLIGVFYSTHLLSCNTTAQTSSNKLNIKSSDSENDTIKVLFSRKQIDEKLKHLAETPAPEKLAYGAECYEIAYHENVVYEYHCPLCSEKTIYKKAYALEDKINSCRYELEKVKGINIKLDEKELCMHCSPNTKEPKIYLLVNIPGQTDTTRISAFDHLDIRLIHEFLNDKLIHKDEQDGESPLKNNIGRIKELLGI